MAANTNEHRRRHRGVASPSARHASALPLALRTAVPEVTARPIVTRATYRQLLLRGLDAPAAGNLTAFLAGLAIGEQPWSLPEINGMLFLRDLAQHGRWSGSGLDHLEDPAAA